MTPTPSARHARLEALVDQLGKCSPKDVMDILDCPKGLDEEVLIVVACTLLSSIDPTGAEPNFQFYEKPLDVLVTLGNPEAANALSHVANNAHNTRIRLEAVRRLGRLAERGEHRQLLRQLAKEGFSGGPTFQNDHVSSDMMKVAALESMALLEGPSEADRQTVLRAVKLHASEAKDTELFQAGVDALYSIADPSDIEDIVQIAGECSNARMVLRLSHLPPRSHRGYRPGGGCSGHTVPSQRIPGTSRQ